MRPKVLSFSLSLLFLLLVAGCVQVESRITVNKDGSGAIEETILIRKELVDQMRAFVISFTAAMAKESGQEVPEAKPEDFKLLDEEQVEELKAGAGAMGEGVEFVKAEEVVNENFEGYRAYYKFKDINKLLFNQNPGSKVPKSGDEDEEVSELIRFKFAKGDPSTLTIIMPKNEMMNPSEGEAGKETAEKTSSGEGKKEPGESQAKAEESEAPAEKTDEEKELEEMTKEMLKDMRVAVIVNVSGKITETNAMFREGGKITLMEMDFGKLIENQEAFGKFSGENDGTIESAKALMQKIPGMKVDLNKEITVKFK